jgi:pimeloyl-ACP methyl ester carboxylesterase
LAQRKRRTQSAQPHHHGRDTPNVADHGTQSSESGAMTDHTTLSVENNGLPTQISTRLRLGGDDLVVMLHGLGCTKESFSEAFRAPQLKNLSLCSFDFPGHGESGSWHRNEYSLDAYALVTERVLEQVRAMLPGRPGRVFLVGHSMGGAVGLLAAQGIPALTHYMSVEGNLVADDCGLISRRIAGESSARFASSGYSTFLTQLQASKRKDLRSWAHWYSAADPLAVHESARSLVEWSDSGKLLQTFLDLAVSKTYIFGGEENKSHVVPRLADCRTVRIDNAGHFVMIDRPKEFYNALSDSLSASTTYAY